MRIASHTLAYNVSRFLPHVLDNVGPHVDKIYVAYPRRPWVYNQSVRDAWTNPTSIEEVLSSRYRDKIEIVEGDWEREEDTRNTCLFKAREEGFDWLLTHDADEFYTDTTWRQIRTFLEHAPDDILNVSTTWINFWKSAQYVLEYDHGSIKDRNANFALRLKPGVQFAKARMPTFPSSYVLDTPCLHFGWALSDEEMEIKIKSWSHTTEFDPVRWYTLKWKNWTETTRNLYPMRPTFWARAIRTPFELPDFAQRYAPSLEGKAVLGARDRIGDAIYDMRAVSKEKARSWYRTLTGGRAEGR